MSDHVCDTCRDKPGSDTAIAKGCICGSMDNWRGHNTERAVIVVGCPVHHPERRPYEGQPRPMPEFSPERARLLAERPAHPWTPPDGLTLHRLEDVADEFGVEPDRRRPR